MGPNNSIADLFLKKALFSRHAAGALLVFGLAAIELCASAEVPQFDIQDRELFPPQFFPDLHERSEAELLLAGLRSLYPKRVLTSPPNGDLPAPVPPLVRTIGANGAYIRVLNLSEALPVIQENLSRQVLILDFRFLATDLDSTITLGSMLTRQPEMRLPVLGEYPARGADISDGALVIEGRQMRRAQPAVFTLSNHETQGPVEALLDQLKHDGEIISVGTPSAGRTAVFRQFPNLPRYYLIHGEIRAADGDSLVEEGFLPRVRVNVSAEEDLIGYSRLRDDVPLEQVVQARVAKQRFDEARLLRERGALPPQEVIEEPQPDQDDPQPALDLILQRAINIVRALEALGEISG